MRCSIRNLVVSDDHRIGIDFHVVLVAEVCLMVILGPARINVFLIGFTRLTFPSLGHLAMLYHLVFFPSVRLAEHIEKINVDDSPRLGNHPVLFQDRVECTEQLPVRPGSAQRFSKAPQRGEIRHCAAKVQLEKPLKGATIIDLIFNLSVRKDVAALQNQDLEHQHQVGGLAQASDTFGLLTVAYSRGRNIWKLIYRSKFTNGCRNFVNLVRRSDSSKKASWWAVIKY